MANGQLVYIKRPSAEVRAVPESRYLSDMRYLLLYKEKQLLRKRGEILEILDRKHKPKDLEKSRKDLRHLGRDILALQIALNAVQISGSTAQNALAEKLYAKCQSLTDSIDRLEGRLSAEKKEHDYLKIVTSLVGFPAGCAGLVKLIFGDKVSASQLAQVATAATVVGTVFILQKQISSAWKTTSNALCRVKHSAISPQKVKKLMGRLVSPKKAAP